MAMGVGTWKGWSIHDIKSLILGWMEWLGETKIWRCCFINLDRDTMECVAHSINIESMIFGLWLPPTSRAYLSVKLSS